MPTPSKGVRASQKERAKEIVRLKNEGKGWTDIAKLLNMDKSNVRRIYLENASAPEKAIIQNSL